MYVCQATAGLRALPGEKANELLQSVKDLLTQSSFKFSRSWVSILDGIQEGSFQWVTVNYLLGFLGNDYRNTVGVVDLGGGSVQMAYAISEEEANSAPHPPEGDAYIKTLKLLGKTYHLYVHSYLHYGLLAARAQVLELTRDSGCSCLSKGFKGNYKHGNDLLKAISTPEGSNFDDCHKIVVEVLQINQACDHMKCTFGGVWNGGGGDGQKKLLVASFFFDRAVEVGLIKDPDVLAAKVKASDFERLGKAVCETSLTDMSKKFPRVLEENRAYICLDIVYQYALLVSGLDINPTREITLVKRIKYKGFAVEAAWALGSAVESLS
ncbi:hypothetical protein O6H91_14G016700 [Diphasiastrum complanatum]|uniref:Uncharacterized protein n=1 Tax=Diphasiastrum complanatum TaxID=34168 RepID=A0ACC2BLZ7_DIPCM|nr:hypothetical protein O6H91_14G016700 [Diphasiastrum complanatum]